MALADREVVTSQYPRTPSYAETHGEQTIVWLKGEHDAATVEELSTLLADSIARTRSDVIIDLSGVDFMGAGPLGVLMRAREFLDRHSRALVLRAPSPKAKRILDLCGIESVPAPSHAPGIVISGPAPALASFVPVPATAPASPRAPAPAADPSVRARAASPVRVGEPVSRAR